MCIRDRFPVDVPTHVAGTLGMAAGPLATLITSFDVWGHSLPRIEIYGSEGSLSVPDPNTFGGPVRLLRAGSGEWEDVPLTHSDAVRRGVGVADMAAAIREGRPHRAAGEMAYHVLDVMHSFYDSSAAGRTVTVASTCTPVSYTHLDVYKRQDAPAVLSVRYCRLRRSRIYGHHTWNVFFIRCSA